MKLLVEFRCGEQNGRCRRELGRIRQLDDGTLLGEDRDGNGTRGRDLSQFPISICPRHRRRVITWGVYEGDESVRTPVNTREQSSWGLLDVSADVAKAKFEDRIVERMVLRDDFHADYIILDEAEGDLTD